MIIYCGWYRNNYDCDEDVVAVYGLNVAVTYGALRAAVLAWRAAAGEDPAPFPALDALPIADIDGLAPASPNAAAVGTPHFLYHWPDEDSRLGMYPVAVVEA
jgi:hypothetical protein